VTKMFKLKPTVNVKSLKKNPIKLNVKVIVIGCVVKKILKLVNIKVKIIGCFLKKTLK
jgi:hypothetical protein